MASQDSQGTEGAEIQFQDLEKVKQTKKFVKTVEELRPDERGYETATKVGRRNKMREIEVAVQKLWEEERTFEEDAPEEDENGETEKFFCNFPYPYMNGRLHLGHAFSMTKADFAAGYHKLKGRKVLFPFAFHCTGMPIQAAANKLRREIEDYGLDNCRLGKFDEVVEVDLTTEGTEDVEATAPTNKAKGNKSKLMAKTGGGKGKRPKKQWEILSMCDVPTDEIPEFVDPQHWLQYFPPFGLSDLKKFGVHVDWRRSFITTDTNPFYDSFVQWQFRRLKADGRIAFGKRPTVYSIRDRQACMDHDRESGEGKGPQEYTLIKMRLHDDGVSTLVKRIPELASALSSSPAVFFVAATLRPETMYGQTNCFVLPEGNYGIYRMADGDLFVCSEHSAVNMAHQAGDMNFMTVWGQTDKVVDVSGMNLLGLPLRAPLTPYDRIYTLPLLTISMTKGTGIVTSVPSDAPDDYAALRDMQLNADLREKYGIEEFMVDEATYQPIPVLSIPGGDPEIGVDDFGAMAAVTACQILGVRDQHDKAKLLKIKKSVYNKGFYFGIMSVGSQKGQKVEDAKEVVKKELLEAGLALRYWEPEEEIVSRSGDRCVIAFIDQWFLTYGEKSWKEAVLNHVRDKTGLESTDGVVAPLSTPTNVDSVAEVNTNTFEAYGVRNEYLNTLEWLGNWACSRSFGLGTRVPWDPQFVVESLSDSTIYMSYYTVAHLLQGAGNVNGDRPGPLGIRAEDLNDAVWDYVFAKGPYPTNCAVDESSLKKLRNEFEFWYPVDLRVSGKDLIRNHLTMSLYNHAAIWKDRPEMWPRSFYTNGHVMVDNQKMSKSAGNFISLFDAVAGDNVHLFVPVERRKINKVSISVPADGDNDTAPIATCTTKNAHNLQMGDSLLVSKSKHNNGVRIVTGVPSPTVFTFAAVAGSGGEKSTGAVVEVTEKNWEAHEWRAQSWTTDSVRYALACAGDTMNDANFESDNANMAILTLENELEWIEKVLAVDGNNDNNDPAAALRNSDEELTVQDKLFLVRMDECIVEADNMYRDMKFSMAVKVAFNDMRNHRKSYRDYHEKCELPMHRSVLRTFIENLVVMVSPVMTHWSEHVWREVLKNDGSVTRASWPSCSGLPRELLLQEKYLVDAVNSFRKALLKKPKKGQSQQPKTRAVVYVQVNYPSWKRKALRWLDEQWDDDIGNFRGGDPKTIKAAAKDLRATDPDFDAEKSFMGTVSFLVDRAVSLGRVALADRMPFDELQLLEESRAFLVASLKLPNGISVVNVDTDIAAGNDDPSGQRDKAEPGVPGFYAL